MSDFPNFNIDFEWLNEYENKQVILNVTEVDHNIMSEFNIDPSFFDDDMEEPSSNEIIQKPPTEEKILVSNEIKENDHKSKEIKGFVPISLGDIDKYNAQQKNKNTVRKHDSNLKKLKTFLKQQQLPTDITQIEMKELDNILCMFILSIRKENGDEYETTSLRSFVSSIDKELQLNNYQFTIAKGQRQGFPRFRETLSVS